MHTAAQKAIEGALKQAGEKAREAAVQAAWTQWTGLGASLTGSTTASSIVDPEALVLVSLALRDDERQFDGVIAWGARICAKHLSVQRMNTLKISFPPVVGERLGRFAQAAHQAGDSRWKSLATTGRTFQDDEDTSYSERYAWRDRGSGTINLVAPTALMLRLRAGLWAECEVRRTRFPPRVEGQAIDRTGYHESSRF